MFLAKKLIARDDVENDILLYRKRGKGKVEGDWLADVELYAESFQADRFSLLATELGASNVDAVRDALRGFQGYFASKARIKKFHDCMPEPSSAEDVEVGVLAALLGAAGPEDASVGFIVRGYMRSLLKCRENPADAFDPSLNMVLTRLFQILLRARRVLRGRLTKHLRSRRLLRTFSYRRRRSCFPMVRFRGLSAAYRNSMRRSVCPS